MAANPELKEKVEEVLRENHVLLFMKGTPEMPQCGFSMRVVGVLEQMGTEYGAIDVLPILGPLWTAFQLGLRRGTRGDNRYGPDPRHSGADYASVA